MFPIPFSIFCSFVPHRTGFLKENRKFSCRYELRVVHAVTESPRFLPPNTYPSKYTRADQVQSHLYHPQIISKAISRTHYPSIMAWLPPPSPATQNSSDRTHKLDLGWGAINSPLAKTLCRFKNICLRIIYLSLGVHPYGMFIEFAIR